ncbi:low affinity immunoglobulin gamma Fc region receptor II-like isoform X1 [Oreochromis aureus]|uniref:low affinity immunoglobulin gamma Fc region receptor II-like isoform X1 n=1 Tax=Oreochromis aureus TaxID=47969 RepID=UPI0019536970|nr:low affinity immunoglobulin gamma Fc region receptor II-like isoform X1 [Oreochromis aureus]
MTGSTCNINTSESDTGVYWCESGSGEFSSAVNITVQNDGNGPILVSPVHPVTEGASVSLSCSLKTQKILSNVFFYHNDKLIQNDPRGELNISAVSKSDEGFYKCQYSGRESAQSWMSVKDDGNGPILVSPVHPVTEGASVSLSCSLRTQKILSNVFFYHNDKLIQNDTRGELKISAVSKSDEGFYKCQYSGRESAQSWMSVKVTGPSSSPVWLMVGLVCGVSLIIILLLLLYRCRQSKCKSLFFSCCIREFIYYIHFNYSHIYMYSDLMTQNISGTIYT